MVELEVEAVDAIAEEVGPLDAPEYVLFGGKGGVGKTTMAAATGLASALDDTRTLVISTDPAHSLADMYDVHIGPEPTKLLEDAPLYGVELDPTATVENAESPFGQSLFDTEGPLGALLGDGAMPGADEAIALQQLLTSMEDDRFDRTVVDTAPTGHTLRLLELPDLLDSFLGRMLSWQQRMGNVFEELGGVMGDDSDAQAEFGLDELAEQIQRLREALQDPTRTDFRIVVVPETLSLVESQTLLDRLNSFNITVDTIIVNRVLEDPGNVAPPDVADAFAVPDTEHCAFCRARWQVQQSALHDAQKLFGHRQIKRVPLLAAELRGIDMLRVVAACLD